MKAPAKGGSPRLVTRGESKDDAPQALAIDKTSAYWVDRGGRLLRAPLAGGAVSEVLPGFKNVWGMVSDGEDLYLTDKRGGDAGSGVVVRVTLEPPKATILYEGDTLPWGIAVDERFVYWASNGKNFIARVPKKGGEPELLARKLENPVYLTQDATHLYWSNAGDGTIGRVRK